MSGTSRTIGAFAAVQYLQHIDTFLATGDGDFDGPIWAQATSAKAAALLSGTSLSISFNAGAPASFALSGGQVPFNTLGVGSTFGIDFWNVYISRVAISPQSLLSN
jgi:hypothetical protein